MEVVVATTVFGLCLVDFPDTTAFKFQLWNSLAVMLFVMILFAVDIALATCPTSNRTQLRVSRFNALELFFNLIMALFSLAAACACSAVLGLWGSRRETVEMICDNYQDVRTNEVIVATALNYVLFILLLVSFLLQAQSYFKAYRMLASNLQSRQGQDQGQMQPQVQRQNTQKQVKRKNEHFKRQITIRSDSKSFAWVMLCIRFVQIIFAIISWAMLVSSDSIQPQDNLQTRRLLQVPSSTLEPQTDTFPISSPSPSVQANDVFDITSNITPLVEDLAPFQSMEEQNSTIDEEQAEQEYLGTVPDFSLVVFDDNSTDTNDTSTTPEEPIDEEVLPLNVVSTLTALSYVWVVGIGATFLCGVFLLWEVGRVFQICGCYADTRAGHTYVSLIFDTVGQALTWTAGCAGGGITTLPDCVFLVDGDEHTGEKHRLVLEISIAFMFLLCIAFFVAWFFSFHAFKEWQLMVEGIMPLSVQRDVERNPKMSPPMPSECTNRARAFSGF